MRSTASFKGHPIHPALIPFPFAFLTGALMFDLAGWVLQDPTCTTTARYLALAGIGFGLIAAVPGIVDYMNTVPPRSSGKTRARTHGILNVTALTLFALAFLVREDFVSPLVIGIEAAGAAALFYAGWLGGTLVNRNLIGVDHRYANKGKWKEATIDAAPGPLVVAREDELEPGQMKRCTHRGGSLAGGVLIGSTVQCLWHGSQFDVETGHVRCGPAREGITSYRVVSKGGDVLLEA